MSKENCYSSVRKSLFLKLLLIGAILLLCQIPMLMIHGLTTTRSYLAESVESEVAEKWGSAQLISGPLLAIPLRRITIENVPNGTFQKNTETATLFVVPDTLNVVASLEPETRYRGIYEVILYRSKLEVQGVFSEAISLSDNWTADYANAKICMGISDMIGLSDIRVEADCSNNRPLPGLDVPNPPFTSSGINIPLHLAADGKMPGEGLKFKASFSLNGCRTLQVAPIGKETVIDMSSPWQTPSFDGSFLPTERKVSDDGFKATWKINEFNRNISKTWITYPGNSLPNMPKAGVSLLKQANVYTQVTRAATYSILIFLIVLISFLIAEHLTKVWMHPLQYGLAALSLVLFYALTLSLSEHIAFNASYWLSAIAIVGLVIFYCTLIFRKGSAAFGMGASMIASYTIIFFLLKLKDYALLVGTLVMFVLLGILMALTGRINRTNDPPPAIPLDPAKPGTPAKETN